jgi:hypothetical protein
VILTSGYEQGVFGLNDGYIYPVDEPDNLLYA